MEISLEVEDYESKLRKYVEANGIRAEHLTFTQSCHSVAEAAAAANASPEDFVKNICLIDLDGRVILAIVKGEDRVSPALVALALDLPKAPKLATAEQILAATGYPCGGTPSFGYPATVLIDRRVMEKAVVLTGGGSEQSLVRISTAELLRASGGRVVDVRK